MFVCNASLTRSLHTVSGSNLYIQVPSTVSSSDILDSTQFCQYFLNSDWSIVQVKSLLSKFHRLTWIYGQIRGYSHTRSIDTSKRTLGRMIWQYVYTETGRIHTNYKINMYKYVNKHIYVEIPVYTDIHGFAEIHVQHSSIRGSLRIYL